MIVSDHLPSVAPFNIAERGVERIVGQGPSKIPAENRNRFQRKA